MPSSNGSARVRLVSCLLAALACGLAAGDARAVPIPTQITYSTSALSLDRSIPGMYEFRPVTDGVATLGSELKLGTLLVHCQTPSQYMPSGAPLLIEFRVTEAGGSLVHAGDGVIHVSNFVYDFIRNDGTILGNIHMFTDSTGDPVQVGSLALTLKPVAIAPTWDMNSDQTVVEVDIFARLEGAPVPEPSVLLIFAAAAGLGWKRLGSRKSRRP